MPRKILFVIFTNDACRRNHSFMYAIDLAKRGHRVRMILEGEAVRSVREREGRFGQLFDEARSLGLIEGVCKTASAGCSDPSLDVTRIATESGLTLIDTLDGHAGIGAFVDDGYDVITF